MTGQEFDIWFEDYSLRFPGVRSLSAESSSLVQDWFVLLEPFEMGEIRNATRHMMTLDPQPYPSEHLAKILSWLKAHRFESKVQSRRSFSVPHDSFRCVTCRDRGTVYVYHDVSIKAVRCGEFNPGQHLREMVVACNCSAGDPFTSSQSVQKNRCRPLPRLTNEMKVIEAATVADQVLELVEFVG